MREKKQKIEAAEKKCSQELFKKRYNYRHRKW